jgi:predicted ester cyclase
MKKNIILLMAASILILAACKNEKRADEGDNKETTLSSAESKQERNKKVIMASFENFEKGNMDAVFKDAAPNFTDYADGSVPPITSVDSIKQFFNMIVAAFEGYKGENLKYFADGDYVLVYGDWGGVFKNDFMGMKATGKPFKFKDVDIFKLNEEGKITEHSSVQNLGAVLMATSMMK